MRFARFLIRAAAVVVPRIERRDWTEAWLAELEALGRDSAGLSGGTAARFAAGAIRHAFVERFDGWTAAGVWRDVRHAGRQALAAPGFSAAVVITLALGIGANTLAFSAVRAVLLQPLPFPDAGQLVAVWQTQPGQGARSVAPANFLDWRAAPGFEALAAYDSRRRSLIAGEPERIMVANVSANFFDVLGVRPLVGRAFARTAATGDTREILLREDFWRTRYAADPAVVGQALRLDDETFRVAGVVPAGLAFPEDVVAWMQAPYDVPELSVAPDARRVRDARYVRVIGRLRPDVSLAAAQAELDVIAARLREQHPETNHESGVSVVDLQAQLTGGSARILWMLFGTVGCVLAIACANVASLLLAGALRRRRELAVRAALGASRARLVRQLVVESLVLSTAGAAAGVGLAWLARPAVLSLLPASVPRLSAVTFDAGVLGFAAAVTLLTGIGFGMAPALVASRAGSAAGLREGGRTGQSKSGVRSASLLVATQLALALVLVTGTGLMLRSLWTVYQRDIGIDVERLLAADVVLPDAKAKGRSGAVLDVERMVERLSALPGVTSAAAVQSLPLAARGPSAGFRTDGRVFARNEAPDVSWRVVSEDYFTTVGARIVRGRGFTGEDREGTAPVAVINATLAALLWPNADPLGARIGTGLDGDGAPVIVVGVVEDVPQDSIRAAVRPEMYRPLRQPARFPVDAMSLVVRTDSDPAALGPAVRQAIREVHPTAPIAAVRPMAAVAAGGVATERSAMMALVIFGGLALLLAVVGLHGVLARLVADRTRELGVRLALGAPPEAVRWIVLRRTLGLALAGCGVGAVVAILASRQLSVWLYGVAPADPVVFAAAFGVLLIAALLASYLPARRASRIDPLIALRE